MSNPWQGSSAARTSPLTESAIVVILDERRDELGLTVHEIAARTHQAPSTIEHFLGGLAKFTWVELANLADALDIANPGELADRYVAAVQNPHGGLNIAGYHVQVNIGSSALETRTTAIDQKDSDPSKEAREHQQSFFFGFLGQALTQAWITFALSMIVTTIGAMVLLVGAAMALLNANDPNSNYAPLITSLSGLVMTVCGGAFTVHTFKARKHATDQANQVRTDIKDGIAFDHATSLIDKVKDEELRDRLYAITAVKELGLAPNPLNLAEHLPLQQLPAPEPGKDLPPAER